LGILNRNDDNVRRLHDKPLLAAFERSRGGAMRAVLHVLMPLVLGALVYLTLREDTAHFLALLDASWLATALPAKWQGQAPAWVLFQLPDAAWGYALGAALGLVWRHGAPVGRALWLAVGLALTLGLELGQAAALMPGRFDLLDLAVSAVAYCSATVIAAPAPLGACRGKAKFGLWSYKILEQAVDADCLSRETARIHFGRFLRESRKK